MYACASRGYKGIMGVTGPRIQIVGFGAQILFYEWYLGPKTLVFGSLDP